MRLVPRTFLGKEQVLKTFVENDGGIYDFGGGVDGSGGEDDAGGDVAVGGGYGSDSGDIHIPGR